MSNSRQGQNADAFDDLLGQLVDELAMTPTMPEEPEPDPHMAVPGGTVMVQNPMAGHEHAAHGGMAAPVYQPPPKSSSVGLALGIGGGIVVLGGVVAGMLLLRDPEKPAETKAPEEKVEAKADAPPQQPPPPTPGATPTPGQPGAVPGDPNAVAGAPGAVPGQPGQPGAVPGQPGAVPGQPGVVDPNAPAVPGTDPAVPGTDPAAATPEAAPEPPKKKKTARKKPAKKKAATVDPFG